MSKFNIDRRTALVVGWVSFFVPPVQLIIAILGYLYYDKKDAWLKDAFRVMLNFIISCMLLGITLWIGAIVLSIIPIIGPIVIVFSYIAFIFIYLYCVIKGIMYADKEELFIPPISFPFIK